MIYRTASGQGPELKLEKLAGVRSEMVSKLDFKENAERKAVHADDRQPMKGSVLFVL